jgi:hypothetical protein
MEMLLLLGIVLGVLYNNRSIAHLDTRIADFIRNSEAIHGDLARGTDTRITDLIRSSETMHADLKDFIRSEVRRLESRIDRLEHPIIRS